MTDGMKVGLIVGGVALVAIIGVVIITRQPAPSSAESGEFTPTRETTYEGDVGSSANETASTVRAAGGVVNSLAQTITGFIGDNRDREERERRAREELEERRDERTFCRANPNNPTCRPASANGGSGPARAN